ncbi:mechanosensitive ion channel family protein [Paludisphaera mucosa]|uniref:Mechanosensitive ion channel family protein n=1 Tax=Paludisphaera mucosa TaxID=3030827 RepID=A0ABT6F7P7_9BACT|nr:mechanosensitive ion channel family protein [Paludisphaera mucosa]MDG3003612.1 mechanosensitive ion channel family protein [Paludisphaera mucosa]
MSEEFQALQASPPMLWGLALVIGFPIAVVVLSELIHRLHRRRRPLASTLRIVRDLILPVVAVERLLSRVLEFAPDSWTLRIVETVLGIFAIHAGLSFVNDVIFASAASGTWRSRVPKLFIDLVRSILVLIGGAIVLSTVWGFDLARLATALGVGSIVIGLALQEPMGNLFAGLVLLFERPLSLGDWIAVDGVTGKVVEINWRSVHIETGTRELRIVPNSALYKGSFSNLSRPTRMRTEVVELGFSYDDPPNKVKQVLVETLRETPGVLLDPGPLVRTIGYGDFAINYRAIFTVTNQEALGGVRDEFMTRIWYTAERHGLTIPFPTQTEISLDKADLDRRRGVRPEGLLRDFPQFALKEDVGDDRQGPRSRVRTYARGERVVAEGESLAGLHLILEGEAVLTIRDRQDSDVEIARIGRGEYFGEQAILSTNVSEVTVTATDDLVVLVLDTDHLNALLDQTPRLARELGGLMEVRRRSAQLARKATIAG